MKKENLYWLGEAPEFDESQISETLETDVIVCGAGIAGVPAARAAVEAGKECILFEKTAHPQARSGQFGLIGGNFLKDNWGIDNAYLKTEIVNHLMRDGCYRPKQTILERFADNIGADFDWYLDGLDKENLFISNLTQDVPPENTKMNVLLMQNPVSPEYHREEERYPTYPFTVQIKPGHLPVLKGNLKIAEDTGLLKVFFKTPVKKLLQDDTGRVIGVIAQDYDGKVIRAYARGGVVLATGDYSGDQDMLEYYCPGVAHNPRLSCGTAPDKKPANTGDGHRMGMWIGAKMEYGPHAMNAHNMGGAMGVTPFLQVNTEGKRFMNEDCPGQQVENQLSVLPDHTSWQFFDGGWPEQVPFMPLGHGCCSHVVDEEARAAGTYLKDLTPMDGYASQWWIDAAIERGGTFRADTIEEVVEMTGLPKEETLKTIARYNELAEQGFDADFGKMSKRLFPICKPPFYATKLTAAPLLCCHGGLESDEDAHCYNEQGEMIPGLYVAGNVQGNRVAVEYPTTLPGFSHSVALVFGRLAGYNAAMGI